MTTILALEPLRLLLLFLHLICCAFAISYVLHADLTIARINFSRQWLERTARAISKWLLGLWLSGLAIIWLDTGFDPVLLAGKSKLLLKLLCVLVLTGNGVLLHYLSFPALMRAGPVGLGTSVLLAVTGSLSTSHWLMAAFVGIARPLSQFSINELLPLYGLFTTMALSIGLASTPLVRRLLNDWRIKQALGSLPTTATAG